jgi:hypothetical protein
MTFNWISFIIGLLSGMIGMFIISKISDFIRVVVISKYYKNMPKKGEGLSAEDFAKIKEAAGITTRKDKK